MKKVIEVRQNVRPHWVGDGFPVRSLFTYQEAKSFDPFLLLDYAGPHQFAPTEAPRGVEEHPHRGFETVTIVYEGEVEHRDSGGNHGKIGPGDVQWMTAASGVIHEEFHSHEFTKTGGTFELVQLWVNLPARFKMSPPRYQEILSSQIPQVALPDGAGSARVIAGELLGTKGPAKTFTPINLWDLRISAGGSVELDVPNGWTAILVVQKGSITLNDSHAVEGVQLALLDRQGEGVSIKASTDTMALLLAGEPIGESVVGHGPFVMNTQEEIHQAIRDYQSGRMGSLRTPV